MKKKQYILTKQGNKYFCYSSLYDIEELAKIEDMFTFFLKRQEKGDKVLIIDEIDFNKIIQEKEEVKITYN